MRGIHKSPDWPQFRFRIRKAKTVLPTLLLVPLVRSHFQHYSGCRSNNFNLLVSPCSTPLPPTCTTMIEGPIFDCTTWCCATSCWLLFTLDGLPYLIFLFPSRPYQLSLRFLSINPSKIMFKRAKQSIETFNTKLPKQQSSLAPAYVWGNVDQDPVPVERRVRDVCLNHSSPVSNSL